jgi:hypothetical protein
LTVIIAFCFSFSILSYQRWSSRLFLAGEIALREAQFSGGAPIYKKREALNICSVANSGKVLVSQIDAFGNKEEDHAGHNEKVESESSPQAGDSWLVPAPGP